MDWRRPLRATRKTVEVARRLHDLETVTYDGKFVTLDDAQIQVPHGPSNEPRTTEVYVGAKRQKMLELTGHHADGCILNHLVTPADNERALAAIERGADRAGRSLDDVRRLQIGYCSLDDNPDVALDRMRRFIAQ